MQGLATKYSRFKSNWKYLGIIKSQLMKNEINKRSELILEIKNAYDSISDEVISNLIESFPSRLQQWIENEGDRIPY